MRTFIAGLYAWRAGLPTSAADKERMAGAADSAFRQAWTLCPDSPKTLYRYVNFLMGQNRLKDALQIAETSAQLPQAKGNGQRK